jgi:phosphoglycerol transferase MdoB-like AlkP superfamily enzyme
LAPHYQDLAAAVAQSRRFAVSAFITAPTFGGSSWLSHSSFLTGIELRDEGDYQLLLTSRRDTWARLFQAQGYRAVALMPGVRKPWPEGRFYGFERIYDAASLNYRGPAFGWWRIPDQYSLARLHRVEIEAPDRRPLLIVFPTISNHNPFRPTPVYQPDWERVLTADPFPPEAVAAALEKTDAWLQFGSAYVETLAYELNWLAGYLRAWGRSDTVFVVLGDHQPQASVTGAGAPWDVPVHIIGRHTGILDTLVRAGFVPGFSPPRPPIAKTHELGQLLLGAFSAQPEARSLPTAR